MKLPHEMRKITAYVPVETLDELIEDTGLGVSEILRQALNDYRHRLASERLRSLRGSLKLDAPYDWPTLKKTLRGEDRDLSQFLKPKP